jgi:L-ascorbate 6-phosphate lactonase
MTANGAEKMKITWLGQSGYLLQDGAVVLCLDPYISDAVERVAGRKRQVTSPIRAQDLTANAIICTHNHLDHLDPDAIGQMNKEKLVFYAPSDCEATLRELGVGNYVPFDAGAKAKLGEFELEAVFAAHSIPAIGLIIRFRGKVLYFSGDTLYHRQLEALQTRGIDLMFVCINGKLGNMTVEEAVHLAKIIKPKVGIPNHYGMFACNSEDPKLFTSQLERSFIMEVGREYTLAELEQGNV